MQVFEVLLLLNITAVFYLAFSYIPRLEEDVENALRRIVHLSKIKDMRLKSIHDKKIEEAIYANERVTKAFSRHRLFKVYVPLFLLSIPLLVAPLMAAFPIDIVSITIVYRLWGFMIFLGIIIPLITVVGAMMPNRAYSKYQAVILTLLSQKEYGKLLIE